MNILDRTQEWLADRVSWVQYPNLRKVASKPDWKPYRGNPFILTDENHTTDKARLSWLAAIPLLLVSLMALMILVPLLLFGFVFVWGAVSSLF
ncbi:hypothetical protein [Ralstonia syzygii]|uniref:hypothetical protein n=1 Tax=Ralstonia syzygii TaxID=28097 RepID=UPI003516ED7E